ncbi:MAG: FHA domain-containing protein [Enhygromyxa sp.]
MAVRLIIEDLEGATTVVNLGNEDVTIGRKPHNTIQLTEQNVSRSHAKLIFQDEGWVVQDLGSYNGVRVNGVPISGATVLRESDLIQIGDYHLTLTDDVDRETVDIERPRAANDHMVAGVSAGASSELPSVSVDDLPPMRPSNMAPGDSAAYRSDSIGARREDEKSKVGLIIGVVGIIGAVLAVLAVAILVGRNIGGDTDESGEKVADKSESPTSQDAQPSDPVVLADSGEIVEEGPAADDDDAAVAEDGELVETDGGGAILEESDEGSEGEDGDDELSPTDGGGELVETDGGDDPEEPVAPKLATKPKPKPKTQAPTQPKLPPDEALAQARKASLTGNNRKAYSLAKDAYDQNKSSEALGVMGVAACKMGSESKAKAAYKKMTDSKDKQNLEKICQTLGIELK